MEPVDQSSEWCRRLLSPEPAARSGFGSSEQLRRTVWTRTARLVRRRRYRQMALGRLCYAIGLTACYAAGLITMWLLTGRVGAGGTAEPAPGTGAAVALTPPDQQAKPPAQPTAPDQSLPEELIEAEQRPVPAPVLERWALLVNEQRRPELLQQAGDQYWAEGRDPEAALRCYAQAVKATRPGDIDPKDNWLVMALKMARP